MRERLVVLSDLHLGFPGRLNNFHAAEELATLLDSLEAPATTLVLAGDLFDFLQVPERPSTLSLEGAPRLVDAHLKALRDSDGGSRALDGLSSFVSRGGECIAIPGNHDPELYHPDVDAVLLKALQLGPQPERFSVFRQAGPLQREVGPWRVVIGHGHLGDALNRIDPARVHRALARGDRDLPLPPGSVLVLEIVNAYKRALDPESGQPRFPFIDLLKPESWVALLLLALDPKLALTRIPSLARPGLGAIVAALKHRLRGGPVLAAVSAASAASAAEDEPFAWEGVIAEALAASLTQRDATAPGATANALAGHLRGDPLPQAGLLAVGGRGFELLLRAASLSFHDGGDHFDSSKLSALDRGIVEEQLGHDKGPTVVIAGHTHAAREHRLPGQRVYLNTGTWTDMMRVPRDDGDGQLQRWAEDLKHGRGERLRRLTYAEITPESADLKIWPGTAAGGEKPST